MLQTGHHREPGDDRPKRTGGRQGAGACCFFFARGIRAHIRGSAPEPQRVSCCAADAWSARLMACATSGTPPGLVLLDFPPSWLQMPSAR